MAAQPGSRAEGSNPLGDYQLDREAMALDWGGTATAR